MSNLNGEVGIPGTYGHQSTISHIAPRGRIFKERPYLAHTLAGESGEVGKRLDVRKEEVGAALNGVKAGKPFIFLRIGRFGIVKPNVPFCAPIIGSCPLANS
jgi:hypothetical protein